MNAEVTIAVLQFIVFSLPIVGALWAVFSVRSKLQSDIKDNAHRLDLVESHFENMADKHLLAFNGLRELVEHVRSRSTREEEKLDDRLSDLECYLEKTTAFQRRRS
jgi:IS4 transposase